MYLGIEIGGTKLQLGVGAGDGSPFVELVRCDVDASRGAEGIREQIESAGRKLVKQHGVSRVGYGFGGPINSETGRVTTSHQVEGWDDFPLVEWTEMTLGVPARLGNDCDCAALAEASYGAGRGKARVFFVTVGTGVGGGFVIDGKLYGAGRPAVAEIGHLRPRPFTDKPATTVESLASGRGIETECAALIVGGSSAVNKRDANDLLGRSGGDVEKLTAKMIAEAAVAGNKLARQVLEQAHQALGWAVAQVITLLAPEVVVIGGGVSLMGEEQFFAPVRRAVKQFVFPPLADSYTVVPAALGEQVVVYGALALAAQI